jgi:catechol-2,3-dioxygenase
MFIVSMQEGAVIAKIRRLQHCVLKCRDVEVSKQFYTEVLGMEVVSYNPERKAVTAKSPRPMPHWIL